MAVDASAVDYAIRTRGLSMRYGSMWAVRDLELDVYRGEVYALLGPNGAGKTTSVEILEGFRKRTVGEASVLGVDPAQADARWRARVGVVPQSTGAFDDLTVAEIVGHFAGFYPAPLRPEDAIEVVGLGEQRDTRCVDMSGGQKRRLDVALGIVGDPELIFLDEPTTGLDPVARRQAWDLVRALATRGKTVVLTTHYLDEAEELADRAGIIARGTLVEVGTITELGGRSVAATQVSFQRTGSLAALALPPLPVGTEVGLDESHANGTIMLRTKTPTAVLAALTSWAAAVGVEELDGLRVQAPSLEDVYLSMIRDGASEEVSAADVYAEAAS